MQVYIYDIDFQANGSPNFLAMRVSSYHKQLGDSVTLLREKEKIPPRPGRVYIFRRDSSLAKPPLSLLTAPRVFVYGIEYFSNWEPSPAMLACRPDYLLYPRGKDKVERSDALQLTDEHGHLLAVRQNADNAETNKDTLITDEHLWNLSKEDLLQAFDSLKDRKNIYFLTPVTLSKIIYDEELTEGFLNLKLASRQELNFFNTIPFVERTVDVVLNFLGMLKEAHPRIAIGTLAFYPKPHSTTDDENFLLMLKVMFWSKMNCMKIEFSRLHTRLDSVYSHYYELLGAWSKQPQLCWFEIIAQTAIQQLHLDIETFYCHPELWVNETFRAGVEFFHHMKKYTLPPNWALWQYKDHYYSSTAINWQALLTKELWY